MKTKWTVGGALLSAVVFGVTGCTAGDPATPAVGQPTSSATVGPTTIAIVGGTPAPTSDYPYFATIGIAAFGTAPGCGGSVIAPGWVLTAAHCVDDNTSKATTANTAKGSGIGSITIHPHWNGSGADGHDVALVHVDTSVTAGITPIQVGAPWDPGAYAAGTEVTIMGIGSPSAGASNGVFRVADTVIRSDGDMDDLFNPFYWFDHWNEQLMIGAGSPSRTVCFGDSGGPLVTRPATGQPVQVGVASFTHTSLTDDGCTTAGGFARLSGPQLAWLASVVPSVSNGWGGCTTVNGAPGRGVATYGDAVMGPQRDASHYWNIQCVSNTARLLQARHSAQCGNVIPSSLTSGNTLVQGSCANLLYNLFELSPSDDGHYRLIVAATNMCLGVAGSSLNLRARIQQQNCGSGRNQQFDLRPTDSGYYQLVARHSQLCMDVEGDYLTPGANIWQYTCDLGYNQQFRFIQPPGCPGGMGPRAPIDGRAVCPQPPVVR